MKRKKLNIVLFGESQAGKTVLLDVYFGNIFYSPLSTIGIDNKEKKIKMKDGNEVLVKFCDTSGQEHYRSIFICILRYSDAAAILYNISNRTSFEKIEYWYKFIREYSNIPVILIACKCDLENREISKEEAEEYAKKNNISYIETSAKNNININEAFEKIANEAYEYVKNKEIENLKNDKNNNSKNIKEDNEKKKERKRKKRNKKKRKKRKRKIVFK